MAKLSWGLLAVTLVCSSDPDQQDLDGLAVAREAIRVLSQYEDFARSAFAEFEYRLVPTGENQIQLLEQLARESRGKVGARQYIYTADDSKSRSFRGRWWRSGAKERYEQEWHLADKPSKQIQVFDGTTVRTLIVIGDDLEGHLDSEETAHWHSSNRRHPWSLVFEYYGKPLSEVIREGVLPEAMPGRERDRRRLGINQDAHHRLELEFDEQGRLVEKALLRHLPRDREMWLYERHELEDYRMCKDHTGQVIYFPHKATFTHYAGPLGDGTLIDYVTYVMEITRLEWNIPIEDEVFVLHIPQDVRQYDAVHTKGWINRPVEVGPTTKSRITIFFIINGVLFAVLLILAGVLYYRHRRRMA